MALYEKYCIDSKFFGKTHLRENSTDIDQEQSDQGLQCLLFHLLYTMVEPHSLNFRMFYSKDSRCPKM